MQICFRFGAENFSTPASQIFRVNLLISFETSELSGVGETAISASAHYPADLVSDLTDSVFLPARFNIRGVFPLTKRALHAARLFKDASPVHFWLRSRHILF